MQGAQRHGPRLRTVISSQHGRTQQPGLTKLASPGWSAAIRRPARPSAWGAHRHGVDHEDEGFAALDRAVGRALVLVALARRDDEQPATALADPWDALVPALDHVRVA